MSPNPASLKDLSAQSCLCLITVWIWGQTQAGHLLVVGGLGEESWAQGTDYSQGPGRPGVENRKVNMPSLNKVFLALILLLLFSCLLNLSA